MMITVRDGAWAERAKRKPEMQVHEKHGSIPRAKGFYYRQE
jgi:hypothetical protein